MAATKSAKNPTAHNDTPDTPKVREGAIAKMKVDELRRKLRGHGVKGVAELKKPDLVKKLIKAEVAGTKKTTSAKTPSAKKTANAKTPSAKQAPSAKKTASAKTVSAKTVSTKQTAKTETAKRSAKNPTAHNDTPNTPEVSESAIAGMKADELRRRLRAQGVKGTAELKKPDLVKKLIEIETAGTKKGKKTAKSGKGGIRTGKASSSSLKYSQEITSTEDKPERAGRSLVTTDHEVIRQWAKARKAVPATVAGTEHGGHLGVLRFDFPGYTGDRLTPVEWDEWLATFDKRRLNFIYQQRQSNGKRSNFFRLENPDE